MQSETSLTYRLARREDLAQIVAIYNATISSHMVTADTKPVTVDSRVHWFEQHNPQTRPLWVLEQGAHVTAWLSFSDFYGRPAYRKTAELSVYVHNAYRRRGLARYLLQQALQHAPTLQLDTLLGFIFGHNLPSLKLFTQFGFATWGQLPAVALLDNIERDLLIVGRRV